MNLCIVFLTPLNISRVTRHLLIQAPELCQLGAQGLNLALQIKQTAAQQSDVLRSTSRALFRCYSALFNTLSKVKDSPARLSVVKHPSTRGHRPKRQ
jgi:hypothetical protein